MAKGNRHPDKDIRKALKEAKDAGWTEKDGKNHRFCTLYCPSGNCKVGVWSTPRRPADIAKRIREKVRQCPH